MFVPVVYLAIVHIGEEYDEKQTEPLREDTNVTALNVTASPSIYSAFQTSQPLSGCENHLFADNS